MDKVILRNAKAEQYICAARKNFIMKRTAVSESKTKTVFCHFSDVHADWERFENVKRMLDYFKPAFAVHTGDLVCWDAGCDTSEFYRAAATSAVPMFNCIGNHETYEGDHATCSADKVLSNEELHERYIAPLKNIKTNGANEGYYYVDFPEQTLRLVVLNDYENDEVKDFRLRRYEILQKQTDWLIGVLKDCEKKGFALVIAGHESDEEIPADANKIGFCQRYEPYPWGVPSPHENHIVADLVDAFQYGKNLCKTYVWSESGNKVEVNCSFEKKSEFICYLNGHRHGDYVGYLPHYPAQLSFCMTCSGCFPAGYHNIGDEISDLPRIPDTISEDAVNFCIVDREKKEISVVRVGAYVNDLFEERLAAKYRYGIQE